MTEGEDLTRFIINPHTPHRLLGSHSSTASLRRRDDDDDPGQEPGGGGGGTRPPPVSVPDIAVQIKDIRGSQPPCASEQDRARLIAAIRGAVAPRFPNADVRATCLRAGDPAANAETIGIWTRPVLSTADGQARDRGLAALRILDGPEAVAFFVNGGFIRRFADETFQSMPKRLDGDGHPDSDGPVHLTNLTVTFQSPDKVVTTITGYDERPWPDVDFTLTVTDTLSAQSFALASTSTQSLDTDSGWLQAITGALALASFFSPWFLPAFVFFTYQTVEVLSAEPPEQSGVGRAILQLLPGELPVPGGQKLTFLYSRLEVTPGGLFAGGAYVPGNRSPSVTIVGPNQVAADVNGSGASAVFRAVHEDFRRPITFTWAGGTISSQGAESTSIRFGIGNAAAGSILPRQVTVTARDADGLADSAVRTVQLRVVDMDDDEIPPLCRAKPWLCDEPT